MQWTVLSMFRWNLVFKKRQYVQHVPKINKTVLTTNLNNYVYFNMSEMGENINNISLKII